MSLLATVAAAAVAMTLLASAAGHTRRPGELTSALRSQGVLPARLAGPVATTVIAVEAALGLAVTFGLVLAGLLAPGLVAAAVLFAAYAAYTEYLRRARQDAPPCGCAGGDLAVSGWVVGRAAALAGVAGLGWLLAPSADLAAGPIVDASTALFAAATFACLLWQLPAAMAQPAAATTARGAAGP